MQRGSEGVQRGWRVCREVGGVQEGLPAANIEVCSEVRRVCSEVEGCAARLKGVQRGYS